MGTKHVDVPVVKVEEEVVQVPVEIVKQRQIEKMIEVPKCIEKVVDVPKYVKPEIQSRVVSQGELRVVEPKVAEKIVTRQIQTPEQHMVQVPKVIPGGSSVRSD